MTAATMRLRSSITVSPACPPSIFRKTRAESWFTAIRVASRTAIPGGSRRVISRGSSTARIRTSSSKQYSRATARAEICTSVTGWHPTIANGSSLRSKDFAPGTVIASGPGHIPSCGRPTLPKETSQRAAGPSGQCTRQCLNTRTPLAGKKCSAITKVMCTTATRARQRIAHCRAFPSRSPIEPIARRP